MCKLLDEKGVITLESTISFSIVAILLLNLTYIVKYIIINEEIDLISKMSLLEIQVSDYKSYDEEKISRIILERIRKKNILNCLSNTKLNVDIENGYCNTEFAYTYNTLFKKIDGINFSTIKLINNGEKIEDYGIVQETYNVHEDIWNYSNIKRGLAIAKMLGKNLKADGSKIDVLENQTLKSIVSIDIRKESYQETTDVYKVLKEEVDRLNKFISGRVGGIEISKDMYTKKQIIVAIPNIELTEYQEEELEMFKNYCYKLNIQCRIIKVGD